MVNKRINQHDPEQDAEKIASLRHYSFGKKNLALNIDVLEYTYDNGILNFVAVNDIKSGAASHYEIILNKSAFNAYTMLAAQCNIPFYHTFVFLPELAAKDEESISYPFEVPMYYVIPKNELANNTFDNQNLLGKWFSEYDYAKWLLLLKGEGFFGELEQLSNKYVEYKLPDGILVQ